MSEYQYYEFRAVDRPLGREEMAELRAVSSRAEISSTSFVNEYHWGDFKGDPDHWMALYFDAFLYYANWGTQTLKLRLPLNLLSPKVVDDYLADESLSYSKTGEYIIVTFERNHQDEWNGWMEAGGIMSSLIALREELARGDLRCLYLGWLIDHDFEEIEYCDEETEELDSEPPVPPGLGQLSGAQESFVEFFEIDSDLIAVAAKNSPPLIHSKSTESDFHTWLKALPPDEKDALLVRLVGASGRAVATELSVRFDRETAPITLANQSTTRRTAKALTDLKMEYKRARLKREAEEKAAARKKYLDELVTRLPSLWAQVEELADGKKTNLYDQALPILRDLRDLADRGDIPDFGQQMTEFRMRHSTKRALLERLDKAGL